MYETLNSSAALVFQTSKELHHAERYSDTQKNMR